MSPFQALILGMLQGATEFIPISSSGHLVLLPWLLGWDDPGLTYNVIAHLGTLCAILLYFRADIARLLSGWWTSVRQRRIASVEARLAWLIIVGTIPGALLGFFFDEFFENLFASPRAVSLLLLVTGTLLWLSERLSRRRMGLNSVGLGDALAIGLAQGCAIAPGISRSGATIAAGLLRGLQRDAAARFSFLLVIPIIAGATAMQIIKLASAGPDIAQALPLAIGFSAALASGYLAIRFLLNYLRSRSLVVFSFYCWFIGLVTFILTLIR